MIDFDPQLYVKAFRATNGELAWRRWDIPDAINAIQQSGSALYGWEVWLVDGPNWTAIIPSTRREPPGVWAFDTIPRRCNEKWKEYCKRTAKETQEQIARQPVEHESSLEVRSRLWFNLEYVQETEA